MKTNKLFGRWRIVRLDCFLNGEWVLFTDHTDEGFTWEFGEDRVWNEFHGDRGAGQAKYKFDPFTDQLILELWNTSAESDLPEIYSAHQTTAGELHLTSTIQYVGLMKYKLRFVLNKK